MLRGPPNVYLVDGQPLVPLGQAAEEEAEEPGKGKRRRKSGANAPLGAPKDKASHFGAGTKRKGTDGEMWEVRLNETLHEVWVSLAPKQDAGRPAWMAEDDKKKKKGKAGKKGKGAAAVDEDEDEDEGESEEEGGERKVIEVDMKVVMENELRVAGITAKKGYEELVYEATVAIMGEAVVGTHTSGMIGPPAQRLWCKAPCPGCGREIKMLVVPGLDVVQCCYCAHWSYTSPLSFEQAMEVLMHSEGEGMRNVKDPIYAIPKPFLPTQHKDVVNERVPMKAASGESFMGYQRPRGRAPLGSNSEPADWDPVAGVWTDTATGLPLLLDEDRESTTPPPENPAAVPTALSAPPSPPHEDDEDMNEPVCGTWSPLDEGLTAVETRAAPYGLLLGAGESDSVSMLTSATFAARLAVFLGRPDLGQLPHSAPPSPGAEESSVGGASAAPMELDGGGPSSSAPPSDNVYVCHWNLSGYRGVYPVEEDGGRGTRWRALLPVKRGTDILHDSLGEYATPLDAARVVAAASAAGRAGDGSPLVPMELDPMRATLDAARSGVGIDLNRLFKIADREDNEDGFCEASQPAPCHPLPAPL